MTARLDLERVTKLIYQRFGSKNALAVRSGLSRQYLQKVLRGDSILPLDKAFMLADLLDVELDDLVIREREPKPEPPKARNRPRGHVEELAQMG